MAYNIKHITYHVLFWIIIMASFAISEWSYRENLMEAIIFELLFLPSRLMAVYFNWFVLIPRYLYKNKLVIYFLTLFGLLIIVGVFHRFFVLYWGYPEFFPQWMSGRIEPFNISRLFQAMLIIVSPVAFTTGFKLFVNWFNSKKEAEALRQEKKEAELKFLKAQTNPHFLFNSLNSIYGLALGKSNKTPSLILKLSNILSYTLYDVNTKWVDLEKEIELIENIIDLEKERFGKRVDILFDKKGDVEGLKIPPLILIPLVENAFKHGVKDEVGKGWIHIEIQVEGSKLLFTIQNTIPKNHLVKNMGGLGLTNVSRRLDLIYSDNKEFEAKDLGDTFLVKLQINRLENEY
ncbi:sensor histidine kinase [Aureisphaera sp.]